MDRYVRFYFHLDESYALIFEWAAVWATGMAFFITAKGFVWKGNRW